MNKLFEYILAARWFKHVFTCPPGIAKPKEPQLFGVDPGSYQLSSVKSTPLTMAGMMKAARRWP